MTGILGEPRSGSEPSAAVPLLHRAGSGEPDEVLQLTKTDANLAVAFGFHALNLEQVRGTIKALVDVPIGDIAIVGRIAGNILEV